MEPFFTFLNRSLSYDCPSCGAFCCKGNGVAVDARRELVQITLREPRVAPLWRPAGPASSMAEPVELFDGCWFLEPSGLCAIEVEKGRQAKPAVCRLFPFNRLTEIDGTLLVDVNARLCPIEDATLPGARAGISWEELAAEIAGDPAAQGLALKRKLPPGAAEIGWQAIEGFIRDAAADHLEAPDSALFAALQEELVVALAQGKPPPEPGSAAVIAKAERLRGLVHGWRLLFGVDADPGVPDAARRAARLCALLTSSWRFHWLLRDKPDRYPAELQRLPRQLLATSLLVELALLGHRRPLGLRSATQTRLGSLELATVLGLSEHKVRIGKPIDAGRAPDEVRAAVALLSDALRRAKKPLGVTVSEALSGTAPHIRGLALSWMAHADLQLELL